MASPRKTSFFKPALIAAATLAILSGIALRASLRIQAAQTEATATLAGIVQDEQGTPVAAAKVTVTRKDSLASWSTLTQADGRFEFKNLYPGNYILSAEAGGFRKDVVAVTIIRAGEPVAAALKLKPTSLHVAVFDAGTRQPLAGVSVTVAARERGASQQAGRAVTDEAGDAYFGRLAPGSYQITAALRGFDEYHSVVFISSGKITTEFALPLSIAPVIPINDKLSLRYTVPNLPSKNVLAIFQDSDGWIWFGTDKGLARFNGTDFRSSSAAGSSYSELSGLEIRSIAEDRQGIMWLATS